MNRITDKDLQAMVNRINRVTNSPEEKYTMDEEGKYNINIGHYRINHAYGGVALYRLTNKSGGVIDMLNSGHITKRELYDRMQAYLLGIDFNQDGVYLT